MKTILSEMQRNLSGLFGRNGLRMTSSSHLQSLDWLADVNHGPQLQDSFTVINHLFRGWCFNDFIFFKLVENLLRSKRPQAFKSILARAQTIKESEPLAKTLTS